MVESILIPVLVLGGIGVLLGLGLSLASKRFAVEVDPRVESVSEALPQINCGACGYAGCSAYAEAVVLKGEPVNLCIPGGDSTAQAIAGIMGTEAGEQGVVKRAIVRCQGERNLARETYDYAGVPSCRAADLVNGSPKDCPTGCLFFGDCVSVCPYDAFDWKPGSIPQVIWSKCTGCGKCVSQCPRGLIALIPITSKVTVRCISPDKGAVSRKYCQVACIACKACEKACPTEPKSVKVIDNRAVINTETCINCGKCAEVCPTSCIQDRRGIKEVPADTQGRPAVLSTRWPLPEVPKRPKKSAETEPKTVAKESGEGSQ